IGGIKLGSVIEGAFVMGAAGFPHVPPCQRRSRTASAAAVSTGVAILMAAAAVPVLVVMVAVNAGGYQFSFQISFHCLIRISLRSGTHFNIRRLQRILRSSSDTAADQHINGLTGKKIRQRSVTAAVGADH